MKHDGILRRIPYYRVVRLCGALTAGAALVALLGWGLGLPFLASLGEGRIPMAPSTALLFLLYGCALFLRTRTPLRRGAYGTGMAITLLGALAASILLVLSFRGIHPNAERLGFPVPGMLGDIPVGHMSPLAAVGFLLASLSFLTSLSMSIRRPWRSIVAACLAGLLTAASSVLLLAYLYGSPLFYFGSFIPPAATTSMAFMTLGIALSVLAVPRASPRSWRPEPATGVSWAFVLVFALLAIGIVIAGYLYTRNYEKHYRSEIERQLAGIAELKVGELVQWRKDRLGDAAVLFNNAAFSALARRSLEAPEGAQAQDALRSWLGQIQAAYQYDRIFLLDVQGRERMSVPDTLTPLASTVSPHALEILESGQIGIQDFYRDEHDQRIYLSILVPILDQQEKGKALGVLSMRVDPERYLYPLIRRWPTPSRTAETFLIRREGNDAVFLNELRFGKNTALMLRSSLEETRMPAVRDALGQEGIVEGADYRGEPVIAAVRIVPESPWTLVARMDVSEVYAPIRERLWGMVGFFGVLLLGAGIGVGLVWRQQRLHFYQKQYEAAEALRDSEERLRLLIDGVPDYALYLLDAGGHVESWNSGAERLKGYRPHEIIGQHYSRFFTPEDQHANRPQGMLDAAESLGRKEDEGWRVRKDGTRFWADTVVTSLRKEDGSLYAFAKITRDLSERKKAEEALRTSEAQLKTIVENLEQGVAVSDTNGRLLHFNRAALDFHGFASLDECRRHLTEFADLFELSAMDGTVWPMDQWPLARILRGENLRGLEVRIRRTQGDWRRVFSYGGTLVHDAGGQALMAVVTMNDITDRKRAEEEIRQLNADLEQRVAQRTAQLEVTNKELESFSYSVSHDLRAPLRGIDGWSQALLEDCHDQLDERGRQYLSRVRSEIQRMGQLIDDLLQLARITRAEMHASAVDLTALAQTLVARLEEAHPDRRTEIVLQPGLTAEGDARLLEIMLSNLLGNAFKFTGKRNNARIELGQTRSRGNSAFFVRDNGAGFDMAYASRLFGTFQRMHKVSDFPGTGVGLATVQRIVHRHGGQIWAEAAENQGATFYFTLKEAE